MRVPPEHGVSAARWIELFMDGGGRCPASRRFKAGSVLAVHLTNCAEYALAFLAVAHLGGVITTSNPVYTAAELAHQWKDAGMSMCVRVYAGLCISECARRRDARAHVRRSARRRDGGAGTPARRAARCRRGGAGVRPGGVGTAARVWRAGRRAGAALRYPLLKRHDGAAKGRRADAREHYG